MHKKFPHKLAHSPFTGRWSCGCGYVLGDGRGALLAPCGLAKKQQTNKKETNDDNANKTRRKRGRRAV